MGAMLRRIMSEGAERNHSLRRDDIPEGVTRTGSSLQEGNLPLRIIATATGEEEPILAPLCPVERCFTEE
jgi:hypothetical protein